MVFLISQENINEFEALKVVLVHLTTWPPALTWLAGHMRVRLGLCRSICIDLIGKEEVVQSLSLL